MSFRTSPDLSRSSFAFSIHTFLRLNGNPTRRATSVLFDAKSRRNATILRVIGAESNRSLVTASVMLTGSNNFVTRLVLPRRQAPGFILRIYEWSAAHLSRPQQSEAIYKLIGYDDSLRALLSHLGLPTLLTFSSLNLFRLVRAHAHLIGSSISRSFILALYRKLHARTSSKDTKTF